MITEADAVDASFVPRAHPEVAAVLVDGETVLHHDGRLHLLNPTASVVWQCCDGEVPVGVLAAELSEAFGIETAAATHHVLTAVRGFAREGLLAEPDGRAPSASATDTSAPDDGLRMLTDDETCASCAQHDWERSTLYRVGRTLIPIATDNPIADDALRAALAPQVVGPAGELDPYYALVLPDHVQPSMRRPLHALQRGESVVVQSRDPERVLRALVVHLAAHGELADAGLVPVPGLVVERDGRAVLVARPAAPVAWSRSLARLGIRTADAPCALVDPRRLEVVVGPPGLDFDPVALEELADALPADDTEPDMLPWGRYPLVALAGAGRGTPAEALLTFGPRAGSPGFDDPVTETLIVDAVLALVASIPIVPIAARGALASCFELDAETIVPIPFEGPEARR